MIDPCKVTDFNRNRSQLEEYLCFCICVAGNNAQTTARGLDGFLKFAHEKFQISEWEPFEAISRFKTADEVRWLLKEYGIGKHDNKSKGLHFQACVDVDLATVTREELIEYPGIGMKTASYFILHSRPDMRMACYDRHVCRWMGIDIPKNPKEYLNQEPKFLKKADEMKLTCAELDIKIWVDAQ